MALTTMYEGKNNSPQTDITSAITAADSVIPVTDISIFPVAPNLATIGNDENAEVIRYNGISSSMLTGCERGFGGTTASAWETATIISRQITKYDIDTIQDNIRDLETRKQEELTFDTTPTAGSNNPVTSDGIKEALDEKQNSLTFDSTPSENSMNPVYSGGVKTYADKKVLYFTNQSTSTTSSETAEFCRISNSNIDANTVVLECTFTEPSAITSNVTWESASGYVSLKGICTSTNCTVNIALGQKGN